MNAPLALAPRNMVPATALASYDIGVPHQGVEIDLRNAWSILYRNRYVMIAVVGLALLVGIVTTMLSTRVYRASSSVQVEQQTQRILEGSQFDQTGSVQDADRFLQTEVDIVKSRALAARVADSLGLFRDDRFLQRMNVALPKAGSSRKSVAEARRDAVLRALDDNLSVTLPRTSRIVTISFTSPDPVLASQVANAYAKNFTIANLERHFDASSYARTFLESQLKISKERLETSERAMISYARSARLIDTNAGVAGAASGGTPGSLVTSSLVQTNNNLVQARAARMAAEQHWNAAAATPVLNLPEVQGNPTMQQLIQQKAQLTAAYNQDLQRHKPDYPTMLQTAAQIKSLEGQIATIGTQIRDGIRNQYVAARNTEASLSANTGQLKSETLAEQDRSVRYNILKRETDTNRTMYDGLLQRYKEVSAEAGVTSNNITLLDSAAVPNIPVYPKPLINMGIALLLGMGLATIVVFARERFDDAVRTPDDVTDKLHVPLLNSIPQLPVGVSPREGLDDVRSGFAEAYFALRTSLRLISWEGTPESILITSGREAEGKSTTAYALARSFAQIGMRVLLIDGDLRKPSIHRAFGLSNDHGLVNLLIRQATIESVVQRTEIPNLSFIPSGPVPPSPTELLSGPALPELLARARDQYDLVVIDGPPMLGLADAILYATVVQGTIFIVESGRAQRARAKAALRRLAGSGAKVMGAVLTKFNPRNTGYGDEYGYYYSYGGGTHRLASGIKSATSAAA